MVHVCLSKSHLTPKIMPRTFPLRRGRKQVKLHFALMRACTKNWFKKLRKLWLNSLNFIYFSHWISYSKTKRCFWDFEISYIKKLLIFRAYLRFKRLTWYACSVRSRQKHLISSPDQCCFTRVTASENIGCFLHVIARLRKLVFLKRLLPSWNNHTLVFILLSAQPRISAHPEGRNS